MYKIKDSAMFKRLSALIATCLIVFSIPSMLHAQDSTDKEGLFMRLALGGGYGFSMSVNDITDDEVRFASGALALDIQLGYCPLPNLAFFVDLHSLAIPASSVKYEKTGGSLGDGTIDKFALAYNQSVGLGGMYYIYDFYGGIAVGYSFMYWKLPDGVPAAESEFIPAGLLVSLMAGKDWRVSEDWALGVGLRFDYLYNSPFGSDDTTYTTLDVLAQFVITYN